MEEARLERLDAGLTPVSDGWFVVSIPEAAWVTNEALGAACTVEGEERPSVTSASPSPCSNRDRRAGGITGGQPRGFLVLAGECLLLIEGEERPLRAWDFVHGPTHTEHDSSGRGRARA